MAKRANRLLVVIPLVLIAALTGLLSLGLIGYEIGFLGFFLGFVMAAVPVPFYVMFTLWIDRFEPEPPWLLALAFLWGAAIATFFSIISNSINGMIFAAVAGNAADTLGAVISAPFVEETTKGLALFLLFLWQKDEFDNVTDGIVYATMVGLGFAMTENIQYYGRAVAQTGVGAIGLFVIRGMMGPFAHPLFTSMTGIGLGASRESDRKIVKIAAPFLGLGAAMFLHFLWNLSASFGAFFFVAYIVIMVPAFIALLVVVALSLRREARIIRRHLETVASEGIVSSEDIAALCSARGRFAASLAAFTSGGLKKWNARRSFHRSTTDFAFHSWRESRGVVAPDPEERRSLIDAVRNARVALGLPAIAAAPAAEVVRRFTMEMPLPTADSSRGTLVCTSGVLAGKSFYIAADGSLMGRDPAAAQILITDPRISKKHAWVGEKNGEVVVVDRGSTNGTFVNGNRVREARIAPGDTIRLSDAVTFQFAE